MKKLIAIILILALACTALTAMAAELTDVTCKEMQFTTKAPAGTVAGYTEDTGLRIYTRGEGGIPYVQVFRRPLEHKFNNPENYLNNTVREYLEDKYGKDSQGMNPAKEWEIGGKTLLGARYYYVLQGTKVTQINVIEIRDAGDVEYTPSSTKATKTLPWRRWKRQSGTIRKPTSPRQLSKNPNRRPGREWNPLIFPG